MYAHDNGIGFWDTLLTTALQAGASVYNTKQQTKLQTEQLKQQLEIERARVDAQRKAAELQAQIAAAAQAQVPLQVPGAGVQLIPQMAPQVRYDMPFEQSLPSWAIPAAIGGGVLLLALLLPRR